MIEADARAVTAVRAIETTDRERRLWSDADRAWASRAAAEVLGADAPPEDFVARRAAFALERLSERHPAIPRTLAAFTWRGWIAPLALAVAFVAGVAIDEIGGSGRINVLAPPVLGLIVWNLAVYAVLGLSALRGAARATSPAEGPVRRLAGRVAGAAPTLPRFASDSHLRAALAAFAADWSKRAAPLYAARAARVLHLAAAAFAAGAIAGLYVRGLAFEYRASWQSTFLDAQAVHAIVSRALAPGAALTGLPIPDAAHIASIREGDGRTGENAALWLHLYAATLVVVVIVPRLLLALVDGGIERQRLRSLVPRIDDPYFRRVLRGFREGPLGVRVLPYSFTVPDASADGLRAVTARLFGPRAQVTLSPGVRYGGEDALAADLVPHDTSIVVALFNATATPEAESHGAFVSAVRAQVGAGADCVAIVDESAFRERWPEDEARLDARRAAWRDLLSGLRVPVVFIHLARPDLPVAEAALEAALERVQP